jgi:osmoprotectant transport system substrate-binding protein
VPRHISVLAFAPAVDRNAIAMRADTAKQRGIKRISDLAPLASTLDFVGPPECAERPSCLPALEKNYGLHFRSFTAVPAGLQTALQLQAGEADVGVAFTTDPLVRAHGLVLLEPDREEPRVENVVPLVRSPVLAAHPEARAALEFVTKRLTTDELQRLNLQVVDGRTPRAVAGEWLRTQGIS